jgi:hypothetical protein
MYLSRGNIEDGRERMGERGQEDGREDVEVP